MAVRTDFAPGEVLTSSDLNDTFASKLNIQTGVIRQIARNSTGVTAQTTNSGTPVDLTSLAVGIAPRSASSTLLIISIFNAKMESTSVDDLRAQFYITDASNNPLTVNGATFGSSNISGSGTRAITSPVILVATAAATDTSSRTYKTRANVVNTSSTLVVRNNVMRGQFLVMELAA